MRIFIGHVVCMTSRAKCPQTPVTGREVSTRVPNAYRCVMTLTARCVTRVRYFGWWSRGDHSLNLPHRTAPHQEARAFANDGPMDYLISRAIFPWHMHTHGRLCKLSLPKILLPTMLILIHLDLPLPTCTYDKLTTRDNNDCDYRCPERGRARENTVRGLVSTLHREGAQGPRYR